MTGHKNGILGRRREAFCCFFRDTGYDANRRILTDFGSERFTIEEEIQSETT